MKLFSNYLDGISHIVNKSEMRYFSNSLPTYMEKGFQNQSVTLNENKNNKVLIEFDDSILNNLFGKNLYSIKDFSIGTHPDFANIKHHEYQNHYCVSMFVDIKGSTRLNEKYSLLEIRKIKDTILTLAIHAASHFAGHVHRLQGDGVFLQFVRKGQKEQDAVINALNTASVLSHFISNDLAAVFKEKNIKPLSIRIGIDLGFADDVIWSYYGVPTCSELTTASLHTDLAAKLQAQAESNGILIGDNLREILDIKPEFCQDVIDSDGEKDYYIYQGFKNYRKFKFNWNNYLKSFDFFKSDSNGTNLIIEIPTFRLKCEIINRNKEVIGIYNQNSMALTKNTELRYTILDNNIIYTKKSFDKIEWQVFNSGKEAKMAKQERHDFGGIFKDKIKCETTAEYIGHHYIECIIKREYLDNKKMTYSIFVQ